MFFEKIKSKNTINVFKINANPKEVKTIFLPFSGFFATSVDIVVGNEKLATFIPKTNRGFTKELMDTALTPRSRERIIRLDIEMIFVSIPMNIKYTKLFIDDFLFIFSPLILKNKTFSCILKKQLCIYLYLYKYIANSLYIKI